MSGTDIPYHRPSPPLILQQIVIKQYQDIVGMQEPSGIVNDANAVRISVGSKADIAVIINYISLQRTQGRIGRRRKLTAK